MSSVAFTLDHWANYLTEDVRNTITSFVNDCAHGIRRHRGLCFVGSGGNGKSALVEEIRQFLGPNANLTILHHEDDADNDFIDAMNSGTNVIVCANSSIGSNCLEELPFDHRFTETESLVYRLCKADRDLVDLGMAHSHQVISPDSDSPAVGLIFHVDVDDVDEKIIIIDADGKLVIDAQFDFFHHSQPFQSCTLLPLDPTLCCFFVRLPGVKFSASPLKVYVKGKELPVKLITPNSVSTSMDHKVCLKIRQLRQALPSYLQ